MEKIATNEKKSLEEAVIDLNDTTTRLKKSFLGIAGIIVGVFLAFVVAIMTMTDIKMRSITDFAEIALEFFALLFVSYQMYVNAADSGKRAGLETDTYLASHSKYTALRNMIIDKGLQSLLPGFCADYIQREQVHTRTIIVANIGMGYDELIPYLKTGKDTVKKDKTLSRAQRRAIAKAIAVAPIKLTPNMIMRGGEGRRSPLGMSPEAKKTINFAFKLASTAIISLFIGMLAFEVVMQPTPATAIYIIMRMVPIILNGFTGYKFGYENIIFDTAGYMDNQSAVIEEFKQYVQRIEENREEKDVESADEI